MRFSHLLAAILVLTSVTAAQPTPQVPPSKGKPATGWSSLPPDAQRAILAKLEEDDPGWTQQAELTASDGQSGDELGYSVAVDGNTAVVGAPQHKVGSHSGQGVAYVFAQSDGAWSQQAELTASDGRAFDRFGSFVGISGSTIAVGAGWRTVRSKNSQGAVYVFSESGGTWTQQAELTPSDGGAYNYFGFSVALSGTALVVGAPGHPTHGPNVAQGAAYVFSENGGTWTQQAELTASDGAAYDQLGSSVAVNGITVLAGAPCHMVGANTCQGAAYVFNESGGTWTQQAELTMSDPVLYDQFGWSLAVNDGIAVVGSNNHTVGSNIGQGAAYVFVKNGGTWTQQAELTAPDGVADDHFGSSVALSGGTSVVGAVWHPYSAMYSTPGPGAAYVFVESGGTWSQQAELTASDGADNGYFGHSVALSNSTAVAGAYGHIVGLNAYQGAAYVFGSGSSQPAVTLSPTSLSFGNEAVNYTSAAKTVTVKNTGTATLDISGIMPNGDFAISGSTCGATLAVQKSCKVRVTFTPEALGKLTGMLTFTNNAPNSPQTVALSGTGVEPATLTPAKATYAKQKVGTTSPAKTFTLTNNQTMALTGIAISTTGDFAISATTCTTSLAEKKKCTISVTFTPAGTGTRTGQLSVSDSASNSPQTASLTGTGD